jgi:hypothetical protein
MATLYPTNKDNFTNPSPTDEMAVVGHAEQHQNANDAIEALQNKVGIDNDTNPASIDNRVKQLEEQGEQAGGDIDELETDLTNLDADYQVHKSNTSNPHSVTKAQVGLGNVTNDAQVTLTGDQTIAGVKTFTSSPQVPAPSVDTDVANKKYVDDKSESAYNVKVSDNFVPNAGSATLHTTYQNSNDRIFGLVYTGSFFEPRRFVYSTGVTTLYGNIAGPTGDIETNGIFVDNNDDVYYTIRTGTVSSGVFNADLRKITPTGTITTLFSMSSVRSYNIIGTINNRYVCILTGDDTVTNKVTIYDIVNNTSSVVTLSNTAIQQASAKAYKASNGDIIIAYTNGTNTVYVDKVVGTTVTNIVTLTGQSSLLSTFSNDKIYIVNGFNIREYDLTGTLTKTIYSPSNTAPTSLICFNGKLLFVTVIVSSARNVKINLANPETYYIDHNFLIPYTRKTDENAILNGVTELIVPTTITTGYTSFTKVS